MPLAVATPDQSGAIQLNWIHGDHLGTPIVATDSTGALATTPDDYLAAAFPGQSRMFADLYYNRYRDYDPSTGRYIQADPIGLGGGANLYSYALGNPINFYDPTGEVVPMLLGAAVGAAVEAATNPCADLYDLAFAAALGGFGGGVGKLALLRHGPRSLARVTGKEWSHSIPRAWVNKLPSGKLRNALNRRGGYNGSWSTPKRHYKHDQYRYPIGYEDWGDKLPRPIQVFERVPDWMKASVGSGLAGAIVAGNCGC